ncbi:MAG: U32 family peptidase [Leptospiraceae bacterium]|nr:U32 family peptidase [Leptospiraceae bacterium]MCP5499045.1 U32 family peptidase [Leptospiraceae bacterium]
MPAGSLEKLKIAFLYGADAVYCGVPRFSLRARENEFRLETLKEAVEYAHNLNKKVYFTINGIPRNSKLPSFPRYIDEMAALKPDGLIMADPGLILNTREMHPELDIHISVQANVMNYETVRFWQKIGATRVILSREVSIPEVAEIKQKIPDMELEVFVHGAICIAHSGRCLMSNYFKQRDANQGTCNNACRDQYKVFVTNPRQNDELMEITEDESGTYLMNSKDLRAIEYIDEIVAAGVDSLKVEGRTKGEYYLALVARSYRKAIDDLVIGNPFDKALLEQLDKVASRRYFSGFLSRGLEKVTEEESDFQNYEEGNSRIQTQMYAGKIKRFDAERMLGFLDIKNKVKIGDKLEIFMPGREDTELIQIEEIFYYNKPKDVVSGGLGEVAFRFPFIVPENSFLSVLKNETVKT